MSDSLLFLTLEHILELHRISLEQDGGLGGTRDEGALSSALHQAQNAWHYENADIFLIAANYAYHLAESQAFIDGNKRVGMSAAITFLKLNNVVVGENTDVLHRAMILIASRKISKIELAVIFKSSAKYV